MKKRVIIIAEAGVNHNGDLDLAKLLVRKAKEAGADIVKFQTAKADALVSKEAPLARYQANNTGSNGSQKEMLQKLLLPYEAFEELARCCKQEGIRFISTPFDIESIRFLNPMLELWKIPSGEITNYPYLVEIAKTGKPVIMSTGMSTLEEIEAAMCVLRENGCKKIRLLHCNTQYPTPYEDVNLNAMLTMRDRLGVEVGYSDHTPGIEVAIAAVALGAPIIEKHLTLDRTMEGPDHSASLEPDELERMVTSIRNIEKAMGSGEKRVTESEIENRTIARKSIVASRDIHMGEVLSEENLTTKRPGGGISPMQWMEVIGMRANRDYSEDEYIEI